MPGGLRSAPGKLTSASRSVKERRLGGSDRRVIPFHDCTSCGRKVVDFKTIGVIGKYSDPDVGGAIRALSRHLMARGCEVLVDEDSARLIAEPGLGAASLAAIGHRCDLAVVVGGDGTLLHAARALADHEVPLVGVNLGHLGFLTDIPPGRMNEAISHILDGDCVIEERALLSAMVTRDDATLWRSDALNDVVIHKWNSARMIGLETWLDGRYLNMLRSDGVIVSTPTGSTAYALSAGGPLVQPTLDALLIVPVCPHTMSNRPIVIAGGTMIEVVICDGRRDHAQLTCDGQISQPLRHGDRVRICKKDRSIRLIHPAGHDHYELLRAKLRWAENPRNP
jgi:NAD+ kinase